MDDIAVDVVYQSADSARIFSRGVASRFSKSFLTTVLSGGRATQHSGGTLVLRGFDAVLRYRENNGTPTKSRSKPPSRATSPTKGHRTRDSADTTAADESTDPAKKGHQTKDSTGSVATEDGTEGSKTPTTLTSTAMSKVPSASIIASMLRKKPSVALPKTDAAPATATPDIAAPETKSGTAQAMETAGPDSSDKPVPELTECVIRNRLLCYADSLDRLVLVVHGIGQRLADVYSSFSFVHAVNQLRTK